MGRSRKETSRYEPTGHEGIERDRRSGIYYMRDTVYIDADRQERVDRSLKTKQIGIAIERVKAIRARIIRGEVAQTGGRQGFDDGFDLVIKMQSTKGKKTLEQAETQIKHLRPWFKEHCPYFGNFRKDGSQKLWNFERDYEEVWAEYKLAQAVKTPGRKLEHDRRYLIMTLKRAHRKGWVTKDFEKKDFELNEISDPIGQYLTDKSVREILAAAKPHPKLHLQILVAVTMGMRLTEILHLQKEEIDWGKKEIVLDPHRLKTRRPREVPIPIPPDVSPLLREFYDAAPGPYLFPAEFHNFEGRRVEPNQPQDDNRYHWDAVREATGIDARFHDLRHTAITNMVKAGFPDTGIRKICGVSEATMRRIYAHVESELKERFRKLFCGKFVEKGAQRGKSRKTK